MIEHPIGLVIFIGSIIVFHGSVYVLIALNTGWRFGYWIASTSLFGLMFIMSVFWVVTALGPRGVEPHWIVLGADADRVGQVTVDDVNLSSLGRYPGGGWESVEEGDPRFEEADAFRSAVGNCLDAQPDALAEVERDVCTQAQQLLPTELPRIEGIPIIATNEVTAIRFIEEEGLLLAQAEVRPITRDPRVTDDPEGQLVGEPFVVAARRDPGTLRQPALRYLAGSTILLLIHLWGLSRAERRVLSPIVAL
ncbi:MAG TPA: hypothetical protein VM840_05550 [Actinomycetota bacterium]|nr:hypothetical protein [Actinomycetota bacterium]